MLRKMFYVSIFAATTFGCADVENFGADRVMCDCVNTKQALLSAGEEFVMSEDIINAVCQEQTEALVGTWNGLNSYHDKRLILNSDGTFKMYELARDKWLLMDDGSYWIEFEEADGQVNTIMHMDSDNLEDYVVQYHFEDGVLHLEEPSDFEPTMSFARAEM